MNPSIFHLLLIIAVIYLVWYFLHQLIFHQSFCRPANHLVESFYHRLSGLVILGLLSYWIAHRMGYSSSDLGIDFNLNNSSYKYIIASLVICPLLMFYLGPKKENLWINPKIRCRRWSWVLVFLSSLSWIIYLFAYEFFFRGFLLFPSIKSEGLIWGVVINMIFYSIAHLSQSKTMILGAALVSLTLSLISYHTGSFFTAFIIHAVLVLSNEWISLYYNPDMKIKGLI